MEVDPAPKHPNLLLQDVPMAAADTVFGKGNKDKNTTRKLSQRAKAAPYMVETQKRKCPRLVSYIPIPPLMVRY